MSAPPSDAFEHHSDHLLRHRWNAPISPWWSPRAAVSDAAVLAIGWVAGLAATPSRAKTDAALDRLSHAESFAQGVDALAELPALV